MILRVHVGKGSRVDFGGGHVVEVVLVLVEVLVLDEVGLLVEEVLGGGLGGLLIAGFFGDAEGGDEVLGV